VVQIVKELEGRGRKCRDLHGGLRVPSRQSISYNVGGTQLEFHAEIKSQQLAHPLVLGNCRQSLIKQKLQTIMVSAN
jgi:hypothetical protein